MTRKEVSDEIESHGFGELLTKIQHPTKLKFLSAFCTTANVTKAARLVGISTTNHYHWIKKDPDYVEAFEQAKLIAQDTILEEYTRRAIEGVKRPKFHKGEQLMWTNPETGQYEPYYEHVYSDALLINLARAYIPEFRDRHEVTSKTERTVNLTEQQFYEATADMTDDELRQGLKALKKLEEKALAMNAQNQPPQTARG